MPAELFRFRYLRLCQVSYNRCGSACLEKRPMTRKQVELRYVQGGERIRRWILNSMAELTILSEQSMPNPALSSLLIKLTPLRRQPQLGRRSPFRRLSAYKNALPSKKVFIASPLNKLSLQLIWHIPKSTVYSAFSQSVIKVELSNSVMLGRSNVLSQIFRFPLKPTKGICAARLRGLCLDFHRYSVVYIFSAANLLGLYAEL